MRSLYPTLGLLLLALTGIAQAEPANWLARMAEAVRMQNYQGVIVYARDGRMESMRIVHSYRDGEEQERIQALSGDVREIHRNNEQVTCILPKDRAVKVDRQVMRGLLPALSKATVEEISENYELQELGTDKLLGRSCRAVAMKPRDDYRYGYQMWIDTETYIPLKIELVDANGNTLEQLMFTEISFPKVIHDREFKPSVDAKDYVWIRQRVPTAASTVEAQGWTPGQLPPGFRMVAHEQQMMPDTETPVEHLVFTDGLATVSAFVSADGTSGKFKGLSRRGAVTAFGRSVDDFHVTVVGEVPQATVELIANRLRYQPALMTGPSP